MVSTNRLLALGLAAGVVLLASVPGTPALADDKGAKELDRDPVNCVTASSVTRKVAIDQRTIVMELKGKKFYRLDLASTCAILSPGETQIGLVFDNKSGKMARVCSNDSLTVSNKKGAGGCSLAKFNPITAEEADELIAKTKAQ
ncbi:MAG TPA: hypothetical protein VFX89_08510 [Gammaproteobacteria bacterium]|nr:hypothetical protein [Gammaproteobacteria bacterium]